MKGACWSWVIVLLSMEGGRSFDGQQPEATQQRFVAVPQPPRKMACVDGSPLPCEEDGCPDGAVEGGTVTCDQMAHMDLCALRVYQVYNSLPPQLAPKQRKRVRELCPTACRWCCRDWGPFICSEQGCPELGTASCAQLAALGFCDRSLESLGDKGQSDLRPDAVKVRHVCRISCSSCGELNVKDEL